MSVLLYSLNLLHQFLNIYLFFVKFVYSLIEFDYLGKNLSIIDFMILEGTLIQRAFPAFSPRILVYFCPFPL